MVHGGQLFSLIAAGHAVFDEEAAEDKDENKPHRGQRPEGQPSAVVIRRVENSLGLFDGGGGGPQAER